MRPQNNFFLGLVSFSNPISKQTARPLSGERHCLPSCPRHSGHCGLRWTLQLLGQRRPDQAEDLRAAWPAHHGVLLQQQRQHLCVRFQLRLVKGTRSEMTAWFSAPVFFFASSLWALCPPQGHEYYNPQKKNYIFLRNAAEELKPRNKKWWEKGSHPLLPWRPWSPDWAATFPQWLMGGGFQGNVRVWAVSILIWFTVNCKLLCGHAAQSGPLSLQLLKCGFADSGWKVI